MSVACLKCTIGGNFEPVDMLRVRRFPNDAISGETDHLYLYQCACNV